METLKRVWQWMKRPTMDRVIVIGLTVSGVGYWLAVENYREASTIPLAWLVSIGMLTIWHIADEYGWKDIPTGNMLKSNPWLYLAWQGVTVGIIIAGHIIAYWLVFGA